jgi:GNAT superfamily N-acetyltransferase
MRGLPASVASSASRVRAPHSVSDAPVSWAVRPARPPDALEVVRLAELMYRSLGLAYPDDRWDRWRAEARHVVVARLGRDLALFVVEDPGRSGHLVSAGAGTIAERLPNPSHADARVGYIQWMSTEPAFRRRGLARAVLGSLLDWFARDGIDNIELHASPDGRLLYRSAGFWEGSTGLAMRRRPWDPPPA